MVSLLSLHLVALKYDKHTLAQHQELLCSPGRPKGKLVSGFCLNQHGQTSLWRSSASWTGLNSHAIVSKQEEAPAELLKSPGNAERFPFPLISIMSEKILCYDSYITKQFIEVAVTSHFNCCYLFRQQSQGRACQRQEKRKIKHASEVWISF